MKAGRATGGIIRLWQDWDAELYVHDNGTGRRNQSAGMQENIKVRVCFIPSFWLASTPPG